MFVQENTKHYYFILLWYMIFELFYISSALCIVWNMNASNNRDEISNAEYFCLHSGSRIFLYPYYYPYFPPLEDSNI